MPTLPLPLWVLKQARWRSVQCLEQGSPIPGARASCQYQLVACWESGHTAGGEQRASKFHLCLQPLLHRSQYCQSSTSCQIFSGITEDVIHLNHPETSPYLMHGKDSLL